MQVSFMSIACLEVSDLQKGYNLGLWRKKPFKALQNVNFKLYPGKCLGIAGESGSGKTTLARLLVGASVPSGGSIFVMGKNIQEIDPCSRLPSLVQMIFQDSTGCLNPLLKVRELLLEPLRIQKKKIEKGHTLERCLDLAMLSKDLLERRPHELSGGQRQRVALARALSLDPRVLIADEPAASLDRSVQASLLSSLLERKQGMGTGIILISHDIRLIRLLADDIAIMHKGRFVESGPARKVLDHPRHPYSRLLLSSVPGQERSRDKRFAAF